MGASRLFHAIVVMGASAAACGGRAERAAQAGAGGEGSVEPFTSLGGFAGASEPEGVFWPAACEHRGQYRCESYSPLQGCVCDPSLPASPEDCGGTAKMRCERTLCAPNEDCSTLDSHIDCRCVAENAAGPEECAGSGQFVCSEYTPSFYDCRCEADRPGTPENCSRPEDFFCENVAEMTACRCDQGQLEQECIPGCPYSCQSETPRFGCQCVCITIR